MPITWERCTADENTTQKRKDTFCKKGKGKLTGVSIRSFGAHGL